MAWTTADGALAATLEHRVGLARYGNGVLRRVISLVNDSEKDIVRQIERRFGPGPVDETHWAGKRLNALLAQIKAINVEAHTEIANRLGQGLEAQANYEGEWTGELARRVGVRGDFVTPSAARLKALVYRSPFAGGVLKDTVRRLEASGFERMKRALQIGLVQGESTDQIVRRITGSADLKYADGVTAVNRRGVERIVRTATTHVNVATQREIMAANPALYRGWMFVAVLDERTSLICMGLSGQTFPVDSGPFPPRHFWCRSGILPLLASNPEDPKIKNYEQWLREQPDDVQRRILGKTRFDLWKQGGLNLKHFVDGGRAFTIAELRKWDEQAFIRAGLSPLRVETSPGTAQAIATMDRGLRVDPDAYQPRPGFSEHRRATASAIQTLYRTEAKFAAQGYPSIERMVVVDERGGGFSRVYDGEEFSVKLPLAVKEQLRDPARRIIIHHTHPVGRSFSSADLNAYAGSPGMARLWAHGHDGSQFVISRPLAMQRYYASGDAEPLKIAEVISDARSRMDRELTRSLRAVAPEKMREVVPSVQAAHAHLWNQGLHQAGLTRYRAVLSQEVQASLADLDRKMPGLAARLREEARLGAIDAANAKSEDLAYVMRLTADAASGQQGANARIRDFVTPGWRQPLVRTPTASEVARAETTVGRKWFGAGAEGQDFLLWSQKWASPSVPRNTGRDWYQSAGYSVINRYLRDPAEVRDGAARAARAIQRMDADLALSRLPDTGLVDRGLNRLELFQAAGINVNRADVAAGIYSGSPLNALDLRQLIGKTIVNPAYTSVTASPEVAAKFAFDAAADLAYDNQAAEKVFDPRRPNLWPVILRFVTPKGMAALPGAGIESELILPRGLKLVIDDVVEGDLPRSAHSSNLRDGKAWYLLARIVE